MLAEDVFVVAADELAFPFLSWLPEPVGPAPVNEQLFTLLLSSLLVDCVWNGPGADEFKRESGSTVSPFVSVPPLVPLLASFVEELDDLAGFEAGNACTGL